MTNTEGEAIVFSVSDGDDEDEEAIVEEFAESEDYILRMTIKEVGLSEAILDALAQCFSKKPCEVKARYEVLIQRDNAAGDSHSGPSEAATTRSSLVDKDLNAVLDSFDSLFCRQCLLFDCKLHGCSQDVIFPAEKQLPRRCPQDEEETLLPCGFHCYHQLL